MSAPKSPGQFELDQINLDTDWPNICRRLSRFSIARRFNLGALLRGARPELKPDYGVRLLFSRRVLANSMREELTDSVVANRIGVAAMMATGQTYKYVEVGWQPVESKEDEALPWFTWD